jgi:steroid delta-isomerase-like uncharacterized protein
MAIDNVALIRRYIDEVWNKGNLAALGELVSDRYFAFEPVIGEVRGIEALKQQVQTFRTAFPDLRLTIEDIGMVDDRVFVRWTARATHRGMFMGIPPTNQKGEVRGISIERIAGNKIVEHHESYDSLHLFQIIGAVPPLERLMKPQGTVDQAPRARA